VRSRATALKRFAVATVAALQDGCAVPERRRLPASGSGLLQVATCVSGSCGFAADDTNLPDDGNQCTQDICTGGVPSNPAQPISTTCDQNGGVHCDGAGNCVPASCTDGIQNEGETDIDCGGPNCGPCANTKSCLQNSDCASGVCSGGTCVACASNTDCGGTADAPCSEHVCNGGVCQSRTTEGDICGSTSAGCPVSSFKDVCCHNGLCTNTTCDFCQT
jgi:hypothetical protein